MTKLMTIAAAAASLALSGTAANADILHYRAQLRGAAETPPNPTNAKGEVVAVLDTDRRTLDYTVTYKGLSGPIAVAGFKEPSSPPDDPIVTAPTDGPAIHAVAQLTPAQINDLNASRWIFDISTSANPGGEIRGKVLRSSD
jgi:CHRD domain